MKPWWIVAILAGLAADSAVFYYFGYKVEEAAVLEQMQRAEKAEKALAEKGNEILATAAAKIDKLRSTPIARISDAQSDCKLTPTAIGLLRRP